MARVRLLSRRILTILVYTEGSTACTAHGCFTSWHGTSSSLITDDNNNVLRSTLLPGILRCTGKYARRWRNSPRFYPFYRSVKFNEIPIRMPLTLILPLPISLSDKLFLDSALVGKIKNLKALRTDYIDIFIGMTWNLASKSLWIVYINLYYRARCYILWVFLTSLSHSVTESDVKGHLGTLPLFPPSLLFNTKFKRIGMLSISSFFIYQGRWK